MKETVDVLAVLRGLSVKYTEMGIDSSAELMNNAADEISDLRFENSVLVSQNKHKATQIESLTAENDALTKQLKNARNELCYKCGRYHEAHNGACDGCKWKEIDQ